MIINKYMIHSFSCKNFYSFDGLTTVDFVVNEKAPDNYGYFTTSAKSRLSKVETVIGSNASGKTNLLKVLPFLKWIITESFNIDPKAGLPVKSFMFGEKENEPIELSAVFEISGNIYTYHFALDDKKILSEELKVKNKSNKKTTSKKIFSRHWDNSAKKYILDDKNFHLPKGFENSLRPNASVVSVAVRLGHNESDEVFNYWKKIETNVSEAGWIGDRLLPYATHQIFEALDFYSNNDSLKKEAEKLLSRFDLGLSGFDIKREKTEEGFTLKARAVHSVGGKKYPLNLNYESSGTKQLFVLLKTILLVLTNGGVAVLDEFDVNLHPEMVTALFDLFIDKNTNPKNAQLLFSSHSHRVLNKLDKYQIIFTEKNDKGKSEAWRMDDMSGIRADDNYYAKYVAGAYGAVPKL